jgi:uncharacterized membrane protein
MNLPKESTLIVEVFASVGCGLMGGLLFAFSSFVMRALLQQPPESGIRTMQTINVSSLNPLFLFCFLGTALASPGMPLLLAGCALYILGVFGVTMMFNVPLNDRLATQDPGTAEAARYWLTYVSQWSTWNHVRTVASLTAAVLLILAIRQGAGFHRHGN